MTDFKNDLKIENATKSFMNDDLMSAIAALDTEGPATTAEEDAALDAEFEDLLAKALGSRPVSGDAASKELESLQDKVAEIRQLHGLPENVDISALTDPERLQEALLEDFVESSRMMDRMRAQQQSAEQPPAEE